MKEIVLDASNWKSKDDVYDSFFHAVGAPEWHGRNMDALRDSIAAGQVNKIEVPYRLVVKKTAGIGSAAKTALEEFVKLVRELTAEDCPIEIRVE